MTSNTLIGAENRSRRVETVEIGLKNSEPSWTATGSRWAEGLPAPLCATWQKQNAPRCTVRIESRRWSHSGSGRLLQKATRSGWLLGLGLLDWVASVWVAGRFDWTVGLVSCWFSWIVASGLDWGLSRFSWASISRAGLRLVWASGLGIRFGLTRIRLILLPYPTSTQFSSAFSLSLPRRSRCRFRFSFFLFLSVCRPSFLPQSFVA